LFRVLDYPKIRKYKPFTDTFVADLKEFLELHGRFVSPNIHLELSRDKPDNRFIEAAVAGKADAVITGDKLMLAIGKVEHIPIITVRYYFDEFLKK
jgi:putative PIN family toxin of toxin-antitoxin system